MTFCPQCSELRPGQTPQSPETEESRGKRAAALPTDLHSPLLTLLELPGLEDASFPELGVLGGQWALGVTPIEGTQGRTVGGRSFPGGKIQGQSSLLLAYFKPQAEIQGQGKPCGAVWGKTANLRVPRPHFLSGLHHRIARDPKRGSGWVGWVSRDSPPGQVAPAAGLEANDDIGDLQVLLLLQVGQHAGPEKDLALAHAVQVALELQGFDPEEESRLLTTGHPSHHRALEQGKAREGPGAWLVPAALWAASSWCRERGAEGSQEGAGGG